VGPEEVSRRWTQRREALGQGNHALARRELEALKSLRLDLGVGSLPAHAVALLREARETSGKEGAARAIELCRQAGDLAPALPEVNFGLARAYFADDGLDLGRIFGALFRGLGEFFESPRHRDAYLGNSLLVLGLALLFAVLAFLVLQLVRHVPLMHHSLMDFVGLGKIGSGVLLAVVLALPVFLGLAPMGVILLWSLCFWFYQRTTERVVTLVSLGFAAVAPLLASAIAPFLALQSQVASDLQELAAGLPHPSVVARAETRLRRSPEDFELLFVLARLHKSRGNDPIAEALYQRALAQKGSDPRLLNNYANLLLVTGRSAEAIQYYERSLQEDPKFATAQYNLAQGLRHTAAQAGAESLQRHSAALQTAERLDPEAVRAYRAIESSNRNRYVIDAPLPEAALRGRALKALGDVDVLRAQLWERVADWLPLGAATWVPLLLMILLGVSWAVFPRGRIASACARCGSTVCARCHPELGTGELCVQCHHIYLRGTALDPKLRLEKEAEIHRDQMRRRRLRVVFSAVLMGAGQVLGGRAGRGMLLLALFFWLILEVLFWNGIVRYPAEVEAVPSALKMVGLGAVFLPAYLLGLAGVLKK
jgi:tetratricopeptide (TPR) repeat protein/TM2 domain-containing membrane protein YozV